MLRENLKSLNILNLPKPKKMKTSNFNRAAIVALVASFMVGVSFIILGSISVELMNWLGIDASQFGTLVMAMFLTCCIVQLFIGPLVDKVGYKYITIGGFVILSLGMFTLAAASDFSLAFIACILFGISAMSLSTAANTLMPVILFKGKDPVRASNFGNAFFSIGYILTPLFVLFVLKSLNMQYSDALISIGVLSLCALAFAFTVNFPSVSTGFKLFMALKVIVKPAVLIAAFALFCYISLEVSLGAWIRKLMEEIYAGSNTPDTMETTGIILSLFGVAMMAGRFVTSTVKNLTAKGSKLIILATIISLLSIVLMIVAQGPVLVIIAILIAGLAFAPIFPTILGVTFSKFDSGLYGSIFGIVFSFGLLGGTFIPKVIGYMSIESSVQHSLLIIALIAFALLIISFFIGRIGKPEVN